MGSYLRRSPTNSRFFSFGIVLLAIILILIVCNLVFNLQKEKIPVAAAKYFTQKITVDNLLYLPPNYVFLKNITLAENSNAPGKKILTLPLVMAKISLSRLFKTGKIVVTEICVYDLNSGYVELRDFVKNNFKQIWQFILDLPRQDIKLIVKDARVNFTLLTGESGHINSRFFLKIKDDAFFGYGAFSRNLENHSPGIPTDFVLKGVLDKNGLSCDNFEIMRENFYAKLWGDAHNMDLRLKGYAFVNTLFKEHVYYEPFLNVRERFDNFLRGFPAPPESVEMPKVDLFLLDLDSRINFNLPEIDIQQLKFSLNNNPMSLSGKINFVPDKPLLLDIVYSTTFSQLKNWTNESPTLKKVGISLKGSLQDKIFQGRADIKFDFLKKKSGNLPLEEFTVGLDDLFLSFKRFPLVTSSVKSANIFCRTDSSEYNILLQYLGLNINLKDPKMKLVQFDSRFYDGQFRGRVSLDMSHVPPRISANLRIRNATSTKLQNIIEHFAKVHGKLSGQMRFRNFPELNLKGSMIVNQGYIENFEFLKWISDFFNLPRLRRIEFPRATLNFSADSQGAGLSKIELISSDVALGGSYRLGTNNMVTSKIAFTCSKQLLDRSEKFKPLLRLVGKDINALTFDFRLSGNLHKMNFLWLESDFKQKIRNAIPGFMERSVEKKIEDSIRILAP